MAVFAYLEWNEPNTLSYANISVLRTECNLEDYYLNGTKNPRAQYLRLDLDYQTIGPIFAHPLPHVHAITHEPAARFEIDPFNSSNIVVDFFEFVYRHLQHDRWLDWARTVWKPYFQARANEFGDHMETVISAFNAEDIELLATFDNDIRKMRQMIHHRKSEIINPAHPQTRLFDLTMRQADRELVSFTHGL